MKTKTNEIPLSGPRGRKDLIGYVKELEERVAALESGQGLPIASKSDLGIVKIGNNLFIKDDGTLSAGVWNSALSLNGIPTFEDLTKEEAIATLHISLSNFDRLWDGGYCGINDYAVGRQYLLCKPEENTIYLFKGNATDFGASYCFERNYSADTYTLFEI